MAESLLGTLVDVFKARTPIRAVEVRPEAAVALITVPEPDRLLVIRRAERVGDPWSGHLALPGGRRDPGDESLLDTAIRESQEEVGVRLQRGGIVAELDDLVPTTPTLPPLLVRPFFFVLDAEPRSALSSEVIDVVWLSFARLAAADARTEREVRMREGTRYVIGYQLEQGFLWGITERIITPVVEAWRQLGGS